jgi:hypothetical protein
LPSSDPIVSNKLITASSFGRFGMSIFYGFAHVRSGRPGSGPAPAPPSKATSTKVSSFSTLRSTPANCVRQISP